jgi:hypothetical protein
MPRVDRFVVGININRGRCVIYTQRERADGRPVWATSRDGKSFPLERDATAVSDPDDRQLDCTTDEAASNHPCALHVDMVGGAPFGHRLAPALARALPKS